jgi:hypothetical protein
MPKVSHVCQNPKCGKEFMAYTCNKRRFCSHKCQPSVLGFGDLHPNWKGGVKATAQGYRVALRKGHPRSTKDGYVLEHILIAEKALGKFLPEGSEVHHVDEKRSNNASNNLVICQDHAYHHLLHTRMRILEAGGHPDLHRICCGCKSVKVIDSFRQKKNRDALNEYCRQCAAANTEMRSEIRRIIKSESRRFAKKISG